MDRVERQDYLMERPYHPSDEAAVFLENHVSISGEQRPVYVDRLSRVEYLQEALNQASISTELWEQANDEKAKLFALMEQVRAQLDKKASGSVQSANIDLRRCTWDQVLQEVQTTASRWSSTPKKTSKVMMSLDRLGRNSTAFQSWLQLLPGGDYGSSICGVFALTIGAAGQYTKVEDAIIETLAEIPEIIDNARRYVDLYSKSRDQRLEARTFDLYLSILKALTQVMRFFADSSLKRIYQPLLKQSAYKSELFTSLENIRTQVARVKEEANQCMQRRLMDIDQTILTQGNILLDTNQSSAQSLQILQNIHRLLSNSMLSSSSLQETSSKITGSAQPTSLLESGREDNRPSAHTNQHPGPSRNLAGKLLSIIRVDPRAISEDIDTCIRLGDALGDESKAKAAAVIQNERFKAYMISQPSSAALLINGNEDLSAAEGLSPLSLVAARLARITQENESAFVTSYFCGEHRPYGRDSTTPALVTLMGSLVGQLIGQMQDRDLAPDLSFLDEHDWKSLEKEKLKVMCTVFEQLLNQLPQGAVFFCILDEVSLYETGLLRQDTDAVLRRLSRLTKAQDGVIFKLVLTCRGRLLDCSRYFTGRILNLEESLEAEDSSTWQIANMGTSLSLSN